MEDLRKTEVAARLQKKIRGPGAAAAVSQKGVQAAHPGRAEGTARRHRSRVPGRPQGFPQQSGLAHLWSIATDVISVAAATEMDYLVNVKKVSPRDAARAWIGSHPDTVTYWLEPEPEN